MSCNTYDWKAYALGELTGEDRQQAEAHAATCTGCREDLAHVRLTLDTLSALREEEIPRRIAFVSDKVFEPHWWQMFLRPSFAAACVVAAAILAHGFLMRPAPVDDAAIQARINNAVAQAVAQVEQRNVDGYSMISKQVTRMYAVNEKMVRQ